jgi:hypothetical protein
MCVGFIEVGGNVDMKAPVHITQAHWSISAVNIAVMNMAIKTACPFVIAST